MCVPGPSLPGRAVPCLPSLPPALRLSSALHALSVSPPCPSAPHRRLVQRAPDLSLPPLQPMERVYPQHPALPLARAHPGRSPPAAPPRTAPPRGTPAPSPARGSPGLLPAAAPGTAALAPVSACTWSAELRSWNKGCPESPVWPSPWPRTSNLPRRALVPEAAGLRLESRGGNSIRR